MTNPYTWLKHTDILTVLLILCFSCRKRHFLILKCYPIPHCPQRCTEMGHFQTHSMGTQQPGSSGLAQDHPAGSWNGLGHIHQVITDTAEQMITRKGKKHRPHKNNLLACFHLGSFLPGLLAQLTPVSSSVEIKNMDQVKLWLLLGPATGL